MSLATRRRAEAATMTPDQLAASVEQAQPVVTPPASLARRHRARALGEQHAAAAPVAATAIVAPSAGASEYELQKARLGVDLRRLSEIQSIERKIALKHELLPQYREWVEGVLAADSGVEDLLLGYAMIWAIDIGDYAYALPLIEYVLKHDLPLPERFDRTAPTLIVEEIAEAALKLLGNAKLETVGDDKMAPFATEPAILDFIVDLADTADMPDQVKAKAHKALGLAYQRAGLLIAPDADGPAGAKHGAFVFALTHFRRALALDANVGVKKRIEQLDKEVTKLTPPENQA